MAVTEYWKTILGVLTLILVVGGVGVYELVPTIYSDICTKDGIRHAWQPTLIKYRYMCPVEFVDGKPKTLWCSELSSYGVPNARCRKMEQRDFRSPDLGTGELTGYDMIKFEEYIKTWKCGEPYNEVWSEREQQNITLCTMIPDEMTTDKPVLARELAPEGLTYEELNVKVGGFNHYRYAFTTFEVCNIFEQELDLVSSLDAVFPDLPVKDFKLMKEDQYGKWFYYTPKSELIASDGCEKFGITVQKNKDTEIIEYGTKVSKDGEDYINHPFWDGAAGDQSHITLVVNGLYVEENWEDEGYVVGQENPLPWINDTDCGADCAAFTEFVVYSEAGNKYMNISHPGPDTSGGGWMRLKYPSVGNIGKNFTMYGKIWQYDGTADVSTTAVQYRDSAYYDRTALFYSWDRATKYGGLSYSGSGSVGFPVSFQNVISTWYWFAFNRTMNASNNGANLWMGASSDGDGVWDLGTNTSSNFDNFNDADRLVLHQQTYAAPVQGRWDNLFIAQIADGDYPDTITNFSCPFTYSDAGNTPCKNMTIFFYKDGSIDTTLTSTNCNSTERDWTVDIGGGDAGTWFCNATSCDTGGECDNTPQTNSVNIFATNLQPIVDNINISSSSGLNLTEDSLIGDFNATDPDADPLTNRTSWFKDGAVQATLENLTSIASGNTSVGDVWIFAARVNDGTIWSDWKNSSSLTVVNANPVIPYVEAQMNSSSVYKSPEFFNWMDEITALRVNCTDDDTSDPTGVHVNLTDRLGTLRCDGDAIQNGDLWTYVCPINETINRSLDWTSRSSCTDGTVTVTNITEVSLPWGTWTVNKILPSGDTLEVSQNRSFVVSVNVTAHGGEITNSSHAVDPILAELVESFEEPGVEGLTLLERLKNWIKQLLNLNETQ